MRLVINIPDSTRPDLKAKLASLTEQLSARPEWALDIHLQGDSEDATIQAKFTPKVLAEIEAADAEIDAGNFLPASRSKRNFNRNMLKWVHQHQH